MGTKLLLVGVLTLAALVVSSATRPAATPVAHRGHVYPPDNKVDLALKQRLPVVRMRQVTLEAAIEQLRSESGANLFVDWVALRAANIDRAAKVDVDLRNVSLAQALDYTLQSTPRDPSTLLSWDVQDNVIVVSPGGGIAHDGSIKIYDIRDLMESELATQKARWDAWVKGHGPYQPSNTARAQNGGAPSEPTWDDLAQTIIRIITDHVAADTWKDNGGATGSIHELNGRLIIQQSWQNHQQVEAILDELREKGLPATQPSGPTSRSEGGSQ
jgi:hypothetical protein